MIERVASFGRNSNLNGMVSEPEAPPPHGRPDVVVLNTGLTHKIGTFRMSVDLARTLAGSGFRVLRFDLSGLGDSKMRVAREPGEDIFVSDVRDAMNFLAERYGTAKFLLMGLCSGSDNAHRTAVVDSRVVGTVHLDGIGYRTPKYYTLFYGRRFLSPKFIATQVRKRLGAAGSPAIPAPIDAYERKFPPMDQIGRDFSTLMARNVRLFYIYNHGAHLYTNYPEQLRDTFPTVNFGSHLEVEVSPFTEHTYPLVRGRATVIRRIVEWTLRWFAR